MKRAEILIQQGRYSEAAQSIKNKNLGDKAFILSNIAEKNGNYIEALKQARISVELGNPRGKIAMGYAYWRMRKFDYAIEVCEDVQEDLPAYANNLLALIYWSKAKEDDEKGNLEKAVFHLKESRKYWNDEIGLSYFHNNTGNILLTLGKALTAEQHYLHALNIRRKRKLHALIATTLRDLGRLNYQIKNYILSKEYLFSSLGIRKKIRNYHDIAKTLLSLHLTNTAIKEDNSKVRRELKEIYPQIKDSSLKAQIEAILQVQ